MRSQTRGLPVDEKDKSETVKRPMNSFMLFSSEKRPQILQKHPQIDNKLVSKILGKKWKALSLAEKESYREKAEKAKAEHKKLHPDYVYSPHEARKRKRMKQINKYEAFSKAGGKRRKNELDDTDPEADELMYGRSNILAESDGTEQEVYYFENEQEDELYRFPDDPVLVQYTTTPYTMEGVPYFHGRLPEHPAVSSTSVNSTQSLNFSQQPIFYNQIPHDDTVFNCPNCGYRFMESSRKCQRRHESSKQPKTFAHDPSKYYNPPSFLRSDRTYVPCYTNSGFACYPQFNRESHATGNEFDVKNPQEHLSMPFQGYYGWNDGCLPTFNPLQTNEEMPNPDFENQTFFNSVSDDTSTHFQGQYGCIPSHDIETADDTSAAQSLINDNNTIEKDTSSPIISVGSESEFENYTSLATNELYYPVHEDEIPSSSASNEFYEPFQEDEIPSSSASNELYEPVHEGEFPTSSASNELHERVHEDQIIQNDVDQDPDAMQFFLEQIYPQYQN